MSHNVNAASPRHDAGAVSRALREVEAKISEQARAADRNRAMSLSAVTGVQGTSPRPQQRYLERVATGMDDLVFTADAARGVPHYDRFGFRVGGATGANIWKASSLVGRRSGGGGGIDGGGVVVRGVTAARRRDQARRDNARVLKWLAMKDNWAVTLSKLPRTLWRRVRKGVPMALRGEMWCKFCGSQRRAQDRRDREAYARLQHASCPPDVEREIVGDVTRIYSSHRWYAKRGGPAQRALYRVLRSLTVRHTEDDGASYSTGLGYVCAFLLLFMDEQHAFWTVNILLGDAFPVCGAPGTRVVASSGCCVAAAGAAATPLSYSLRHLYSDGIPKALVHVQVLDVLLGTLHPVLGAHLVGHGVRAHMFALDWVLTLFTSSFPLATCVRVWDCFLFAGGSWETWYRVSLAVVLSDAAALLAAASFEALMGRLYVLPTRYAVDSERLMAKAYALRLPGESKLAQMERDAAGKLYGEGEEHPHVHVHPPRAEKVEVEEEEEETEQGESG